MIFSVGDSGYPFEPWLLTPIINPLTQLEQRYNLAHVRTRNIIERMFGMLKSRFRCLGCCGATLEYSPEKVCKLVTACALLHNMCMRRGVELPNEIINDDDYDNNDNEVDNSVDSVALRRRIIRDYFT